jgi:3-hydroxyacyl-CoA dehydrogenase
MEAEGLQTSRLGWGYDCFRKHFVYTVKEGNTYFYSFHKNTRRKYQDKMFHYLNNIRESQKVWSNSGASNRDLGDGILNLEFQSK